jgi:hypothetical protein
MKKLTLVLAFAMLGFAQENGEFIPGELAMLFPAESVESFTVEQVQVPTGVVAVVAGNEIVESRKKESDEIRPEILLSINEAAQTIDCEFLDNSEEKMIEIVSLSGVSALEIVLPAGNTAKISSRTLKRGVYIIRILSSKTKNSIYSKAIVIG